MAADLAALQTMLGRMGSASIVDGQGMSESCCKQFGDPKWKWKVKSRVELNSAEALCKELRVPHRKVSRRNLARLHLNHTGQCCSTR